MARRLGLRRRRLEPPDELRPLPGPPRPAQGDVRGRKRRVHAADRRHRRRRRAERRGGDLRRHLDAVQHPPDRRAVQGPVRLRGAAVVGRPRDARARARHPRAVPGRARSRRARDRPATSWLQLHGRARERQLHEATRSTARSTRTATSTPIGGSAATSTSSSSTCRAQFGQKLATSAVTRHADRSPTRTWTASSRRRDHLRPDWPTTRRFDIWRVGADAQFYFDIPDVGGHRAQGRGRPVAGHEPGLPRRGGRSLPRRQGGSAGSSPPSRTSATTSASWRASISGIPTATSSGGHLGDVHDGGDGCGQRQDHHPRRRPALLHLGKPEAVGDLRARLALDTLGARRPGLAPVNLDRRAICSPCNCRRGFEFRSRVQVRKRYHIQEKRHMKLRTLLAALLLALARCPIWRPPSRPGRSPSRVRTPWSSSASAGPRTT